MKIFKKIGIFITLLVNGCADQSFSYNTTNFMIALKQNNLNIIENNANAVSDPTSLFYGNYIKDPLLIQKLVSPNANDA